jgi:hypothetical protein
MNLLIINSKGVNYDTLRLINLAIVRLFISRINIDYKVDLFFSAQQLNNRWHGVDEVKKSRFLINFVSSIIQLSSREELINFIINSE